MDTMQILSMMAILTITCKLGQAADSCICFNSGPNNDDPNAYNFGPNPNAAVTDFDFDNNGYFNPPSTAYDARDTYYYFGYYAGAAGAAVSGRIFFRYDGQALSASSRYTAIGCPLYTSNTGLCSNGPYGFASAAACSACGACCCAAGNTANGVCAVSSGD